MIDYPVPSPPDPEGDRQRVIRQRKERAYVIALKRKIKEQLDTPRRLRQPGFAELLESRVASLFKIEIPE